MVPLITLARSPAIVHTRVHVGEGGGGGGRGRIAMDSHIVVSLMELGLATMSLNVAPPNRRVLRASPVSVSSVSVSSSLGRQITITTTIQYCEDGQGYRHVTIDVPVVRIWCWVSLGLGSGGTLSGVED